MKQQNQDMFKHALTMHRHEHQGTTTTSRTQHLKHLFLMFTLLLCGVVNGWADTTYEWDANENSYTKALSVTGVEANWTGYSFGTNMTKAVKMQSTTELKFTVNTGKVATVTIGVSTKNNTAVTATKANVKFDGTATENIISEDQAKADGTYTFKTIDISNVAAGEHTISRGGCEMGVYYIKVVETDAPEKTASDLTVSATSANVYISSTNVETGITVTSSSTGAYTVTAGNTKVTDPKIQGGKLLVTTGTATGNVTLTISQAATSSYEAGSKEVTITVIKRPQDKPTISCTDNTVTITPAVSGATIYYTVDGSDPKTKDNTATQTYSEPFAITESCTVKAYATANNYDDSDVASQNVTYSAQENKYTVTTEAQLGGTASTKGGRVEITKDSDSSEITSGSEIGESTAFTVTAYPKDGFDFVGWTVTGNGTYTEDGKTLKFTQLSENVTVKANFIPGKPYFSILGNVITLSSKAAGAEYYFTTDKSNPTTESTKWEKNTYAITPSVTKVRAIAVVDGVASAIQGVEVTYQPLTVLEARVAKVVADGTFTNSTCTTAQKMQSTGDNASYGISPNSTFAKDDAYYFGQSESSKWTINLTSTSAKQIIIAYKSNSNGSMRQLNMLYADGVAVNYHLKEGVSMNSSGSVFERMAITMPEKEIEQNSVLEFTFNGNVNIAYFEIIGTQNSNICNAPVIGPKEYDETNGWSYVITPANDEDFITYTVGNSKKIPTTAGAVTVPANSVKAGDVIVAWSTREGYAHSSRTSYTVADKETPAISFNVSEATYNTANSSWDVQPKLMVAPASLLDGVTYSTNDNDITYTATAENKAYGVVGGVGQGICTVTATINVSGVDGLTDGTYTATFTLTKSAGYASKLTASSLPVAGQTEVLKDNDGNDLLTLTFGGWTHGSSSAPNTWTSSGKTVTDKWPKAGETAGTPVDGYTYQSQMNNDSRSETKGTVKWQGSNYSKVHPFSLPCRGSYITVVPETNGVMTIYLVQNGTINTGGSVSDPSYESLSGSPRVYWWFDQDGNVIPSSATLKEKLNDVFDWREYISSESTTKNLYLDIQNNWGIDPADESATGELVETVRNHWVEKDKVEEAIPYHNGYFVAEKAYLKYVLNMLAGKTYYFFSNNSKMGYAGMNFAPQNDITIKKTDGSADETVVTVSEPLELSQETAFTAPATTTTYKSVTLDRSFKANTWNSICLPFAVSEAQVKKIFGEGTQLIIFDGLEGKKAKFKYHVYQDILAGQPYFILPTNEVTSEEFNNVTINSNVAIKNNGSDGDGTFTFTGTFAPVTLNAYDHVLSSTGGIGYYTTPVNLKGYRAYLKQATSNAVKISAVEVGNNFEDETDETVTGIMQVLVDQGVEIAPVDGVYNLNGQKVGNSTAGLPAGLYIVNGKKIYIK